MHNYAVIGNVQYKSPYHYVLWSFLP